MDAENLDHSPMNRGKYGPAKGNPRTPNWVAEHDPSYMVWAFNAWADKPCSPLLYRECVKDADDNRRSVRVAIDQDD